MSSWIGQSTTRARGVSRRRASSKDLPCKISLARAWSELRIWSFRRWGRSSISLSTWRHWSSGRRTVRKSSTRSLEFIRRSRTAWPTEMKSLMKILRGFWIRRTRLCSRQYMSGRSLRVRGESWRFRMSKWRIRTNQGSLRLRSSPSLPLHLNSHQQGWIQTRMLSRTTALWRALIMMSEMPMKLWNIKSYWMMISPRSSKMEKQIRNQWSMRRKLPTTSIELHSKTVPNGRILDPNKHQKRHISREQATEP